MTTGRIRPSSRPPPTTWENIKQHVPATQPIPLVDLQVKGSRYRQACKLRKYELGRSNLTISKNGQVLDYEYDAVEEAGG